MRIRTPEVFSERPEDHKHNLEGTMAEKRLSVLNVLMRKEVPEAAKIDSKKQEADRPEHPLAA